MAHLIWGAGDRNGSSRADWLDLPKGIWEDAAIAKLEAAAGVKGDWSINDFGGDDWHGLHGTYKGALFTVYTHKSGSLKIGAHGFLHDDEDLDLAGLKAALLAIITG